MPGRHQQKSKRSQSSSRRSRSRVVPSTTVTRDADRDLVRIAPPAPVLRCDLSSLDAVDGDAVGLFLWSDVRPVSGVAGCIDWRICGVLSDLLVRGHFQGNAGEVLMMPTRGRFRPRRLFCFGLGPAQYATAERFKPVCRQAYDVMQRAGVTTVVFASPHLRTQADVEGNFVAAVAEELPHLISLVLLHRARPLRI